MFIWIIQTAVYGSATRNYESVQQVSFDAKRTQAGWTVSNGFTVTNLQQSSPPSVTEQPTLTHTVFPQLIRLSFTNAETWPVDPLPSSRQQMTLNCRMEPSQRWRALLRTHFLTGWSFGSLWFFLFCFFSPTCHVAHRWGSPQRTWANHLIWKKALHLLCKVW